MNNTRKIASFIFCCLFPFWLVAQEITIKGTVKDQDGLELPGAAIVIKGTNKGIATDGNGAFEIKAHQGDILVFSTIGYAPKEVKVGKERNLNIVLSVDVLQLEGTEVVAVAYGTTDKKSFTGSMATIKAETIQAKQSSDVAKTLEGAVAGVQISTSSGQPGSNSAIRIRGIGSINASSAPLIILDGVPFEGTLNAINNSDIESVNVLKDASSSALYGARGANGVVLITTKSGSKGRLSITLDSKLGFNYRGIPEYDIISSPGEYYETLWSALYNQNRYAQNQADALARTNASQSLINNVGTGYNIYNVADDQVVLSNGKLNPAATIKYSDAATFNQWEKALFNSRVRKEHNLSMTKGTEYNSFYFSFGYLGDEGYNMNTYFNRYATRFSYKGDITTWLKANASSMITYTEQQGSTEDNGYDNPFAWTRTIAPIYPIYEHDANGNRLNTYDYGITRKFNNNTNPVATQRENLNYNRDYYFNQSLSLDAKLLKNFTFSVNGNFYANFYDVNYFTTPLGGAGKNYGGSATKYKSDNTVLTFNQLLRYNKNWDNYGIEALLGHESYKKRFGTIEGGKKNFVDPYNSEFNNAAVLSSLTSYTRRYFVEGYFGQINANYQQKYYLSASLRRDGSSVFAPENRWGTFWSVGASWLLSEEKFLEKAKFIDLIKLKLSYGVQGNDELYLPGSYSRSYVPYMTLYSVSTNGNTPGLVASYKGNRNITWEESGNLNAGIELALFNNRLTLEADYFIKKTNNLLFDMPLPASTGFSSEPRNVADMVNKGFEFSLGVTPIRTDKVEWTISLNGLHYKNEITRLPEELREKGLTRGYQILKEGGSIYDFYMVKWGGVNPVNGDAQFYIKNTATGEYELKGSADYDSTNSKQYVGTSIPDLQGGFGTTLSAYNFDLAIQFSYQFGGKFYDSQYANLMHSGDLGRTWHTDIRNRWTPENTTSDIPRLEFANQKLLSLSDRFMVSSNYLSLRNVSLGYTFKQEIVEKLGLTKLRYYLTADNVYLWSKRKGLDPRTSLAGDNDDAVYSPIRTVSMGLTLNF
ncbi:SusC/RagA family TonB-linked outer membrane protein [Capnocytophaga genosp. AHN8471]|uniref:SusC/RagA family TonB-linked outer membrane protein n=1 Tax=Capnocytophaga genosp. AHN8471 TaxID=327574 RepID=UPI00193141A4|nr:TonB-dependent receptor [Capnocytophaga genosp. AHN8471]MBM0659818.1 TonB-dependent receptor [Capnocytophaga genosp. AHN8471]